VSRAVPVPAPRRFAGPGAGSGCPLPPGFVLVLGWAVSRQAAWSARHGAPVSPQAVGLAPDP